MARRDLTYAELASVLKQIGINQTEFNVRNKVGRGSFSAPFLLQCLIAMEAESLDLRPFIPLVQQEDADLGQPALANQPSET